jgi:DNA-binding Lrp family transcriptional regulator
MDERDIVQAYRKYIERFEAEVGPSELGQFVKHRSRLVKKLRYEEFEPKYREYEEMARAYQESLERGDTINDLVVKVLRESADELFLPSPL